MPKTQKDKIKNQACRVVKLQIASYQDIEELAKSFNGRGDEFESMIQEIMQMQAIVTESWMEFIKKAWSMSDAQIQKRMR